MMKTPLVSVIIPAYNTDRQIFSDTVSAVLKQDLDDFELLIIDDSTSAPVNWVLEKFQDARIRYHVNNSSHGMAAARNTGISLARGEYLAFMDHDDLWAEDKLSQQLRELKNDPEACMVYSPVKYLFADGRIKEQREPLLPRQNQYLELLLHNLIITASCIVVSRKIFFDTDVFRFRDFAVPCDDYDLYLRIALYNKGIVCCTSKDLVYHRIHTNNVSLNIKIMNHAGKRILHQQFLDILFADLNVFTKIKYWIALMRTVFWLFRHPPQEVLPSYFIGTTVTTGSLGEVEKVRSLKQSGEFSSAAKMRRNGKL